MSERLSVAGVQVGQRSGALQLHMAVQQQAVPGRAVVRVHVRVNVVGVVHVVVRRVLATRIVVGVVAQAVRKMRTVQVGGVVGRHGRSDGQRLHAALPQHHADPGVDEGDRDQRHAVPHDERDGDHVPDGGAAENSMFMRVHILRCVLLIFFANC